MDGSRGRKGDSDQNQLCTYRIPHHFLTSKIVGVYQIPSGIPKVYLLVHSNLVQLFMKPKSTLNTLLILLKIPSFPSFQSYQNTRYLDHNMGIQSYLPASMNYLNMNFLVVFIMVTEVYHNTIMNHIVEITQNYHL